MSKQKDDAAVEAAGAQDSIATHAATEKTTAPEQKYTLDNMRKHCRKLFNVSTCMFDGATDGLEGEFTVREIKQKIQAWGEKPVKPVKKEGS